MTRQVFTRDNRLDGIKAAIAFAIGGNGEDAYNWAEKRWGGGGFPDTVARAATGSLTDSDIGSVALSDTALFSAVRERAILFRLNPRRMGFNTRSLYVDNLTAAWVGQGAPLPVTKANFDNTGLDPFKLGALTVATKESIETGPQVEQSLFDDLTRAIVDELDATFLDPANAGTADVIPAAITNGITPVTATSDPEADIASLIAAFDGNLRSAYFTMAAKTAAKLAATRIGRDIGLRGGELMGAPVLTSETAPETSLALIDPGGIHAAFDNDIRISSSQHGAIEMDTAPTNDASTPTAADLVPLFSANAIAFKGVLAASWKRAIDGRVAVLQGGATDWLA